MDLESGCDLIFTSGVFVKNVGWYLVHTQLFLSQATLASSGGWGGGAATWNAQKSVLPGAGCEEIAECGRCGGYRVPPVASPSQLSRGSSGDRRAGTGQTDT